MKTRPVVPTAVFRLPRSAYVAVLFLALGVTALIQHPLLLILYVVPLLAAVFIARRGTFVDRDAITVRAIFASRLIPWTEVAGLLVNARNGVSVVLTDRSAIRLPYVRVRHLAVLSEITGGTVPAIPAAVVETAESEPAPNEEAPNEETPVETIDDSADPVGTDAG